jgi:hypothetical protein
MAKVYIVQENPNVNVIGAGRFGELSSYATTWKTNNVITRPRS